MKRRRKLYGFRGLAFKTQPAPAISTPTIDPYHLKKWVCDNYLQGDEDDVVLKEEIWNHFKDENAIPEEYKSNFFSRLGQYVFSTEPSLSVEAVVKKKKQFGYCFLRKKKQGP